MITSPNTLPDLSTYANTSSKWHRGDNEKAYLRNVKEGNTPPYGPDDIEYSFNSLGFRSPEFDINIPNAAVYGCSTIMGYGLPEEHSFAGTISGRLGLRVYNLAIAGASNDMIARTVTSTVPRLLPSRVFVYWTYITRREIYADDGTPINWLKNWTKQTVQVPREHVPIMKAQEKLANESANINNFLKNLAMVDLYLKTMGVGFSWSITSDYFLHQPDVEEAVRPYMENYAAVPFSKVTVDKSRDMTHPGRETIQKVVQGFLNVM